MRCAEKRLGKFRILYYSTFVEPSSLISALLHAPLVEGKGRTGIRVIEMGGLKLAARKYGHGGLFRAVTRDRFSSGRRVAEEAEILSRLRAQGFPAVSPFCAVIESAFVGKRLYLLTFLEEETTDLLTYLQMSAPRQRLRVAKKLAYLFRLLEQAGVYHPDLHLNNVLVTPGQSLVFLDFDRARRKDLKHDDVESMLWRLARFIGKMEREGRMTVDEREKTLFLRVYDRLSGRDMTAAMQKKAAAKGNIHRVGWFLESLLYGGTKKRSIRANQ